MEDDRVITSLGRLIIQYVPAVAVKDLLFDLDRYAGPKGAELFIKKTTEAIRKEIGDE